MFEGDLLETFVCMIEKCLLQPFFCFLLAVISIWPTSPADNWLPILFAFHCQVLQNNKALIFLRLFWAEAKSGKRNRLRIFLNFYHCLRSKKASSDESTSRLPELCSYPWWLSISVWVQGQIIYLSVHAMCIECVQDIPQVFAFESNGLLGKVCSFTKTFLVFDIREQEPPDRRVSKPERKCFRVSWSGYISTYPPFQSQTLHYTSRRTTVQPLSHMQRTKTVLGPRISLYTGFFAELRDQAFFHKSGQDIKKHKMFPFQSKPFGFCFSSSVSPPTCQAATRQATAQSDCCFFFPCMENVICFIYIVLLFQTKSTTLKLTFHPFCFARIFFLFERKDEKVPSAVYIPEAMTEKVI